MTRQASGTAIPNGTPPAGSPSVRQLIRERLAVSSEPDPHVLAADLVVDLPEDCLREVLLAGLAAMVREEIRLTRTSVREEIRLARTPAAAPRSVRWENAAEVHLRTDVLQRRYPTADGWKLLADFTREDAKWNRDKYDERVKRNARERDRFDEFAGLFTRDCLGRDLPRAEVERIFNA